ncbi:hypothetical protein BH09BAC6_BH09BAC6_26590 [soil metagenome]|jgi:hypothetical protein
MEAYIITYRLREMQQSFLKTYKELFKYSIEAKPHE